MKAFTTNTKRMAELITNPELNELTKKANYEYMHWEKFKYQKVPANVPIELAWAMVKIARRGNQETIQIKNEDNKNFWLFPAKTQQKSLSYIDSWASGIIASNDGMPTGEQKNKLVINGLMEEAISSSQIEGANTTRKVAKAMIEMKRPPKNKDEKMILNNYLAMVKIEDWKHRKLDDSFLLELHTILTTQTLDQENDVGRFRVDADAIEVVDRLTGETVHIPPKEVDLSPMLKQLYDFANDDREDSYIHPFVKASILHFCLGYVHPFIDGNGRSARALFYWYLIKKDYWMFKYLPISLQIKKKDWRPGYDRAFHHVETDELDLTYFINYKVKLACNAIGDFIKFIHKKQKDAVDLKQRLVQSSEINQRQIEIITFMQSRPALEFDIGFYKNRNNIVYETARNDLLQLTSMKILTSSKSGKKYVYSRGENFPSK